MQQRRLRLGDILDDYCPRERRITNHAVVAMIDDEVKQTRCTTCDADHEYKQARVPPQRRKRSDSAIPDPLEVASRLRATEHEPASDETAGGIVDAEAPFEATAPSAEAMPEPETTDPAAPPEDDGPVHRRLIRATLPRPDGQPPERKEPEFLARQPNVRGPGTRGRHQRSAREFGNSTARFGGPHQPSGQRSRHAGGSGYGQRPGGQRSGSHPNGPRGGNRQAPGGGRGGRKRGR